jgi:hypothetical protein
VLGILGRHVTPLDLMYNLFPQFVIVGSHTQRKLIQSNVALLLFGPVALDTVISEKFICDRRFGMGSGRYPPILGEVILVLRTGRISQAPLVVFPINIKRMAQK